MWYSIVFLLISIPLYTSASFFETPIHGNIPPMTTSSPYGIVTSVSSAHQNEIFTIQIKSILSELNVNGFIVHAHSTTQPNKILGRFTASSVGLQITNNVVESATFHAYPGTEVDEVELQWQAPSDYVGEIIFNATVAQDYDKFWEGVTSAPVEIFQSEAVTLKSYFISNQSSVANVEQRNKIIYEGCGTTKTCFGMPIDCITTQSCLAVSTAFKIGNRYLFELQSFNERYAYVSLGLSRDNRLGPDSVTECVNEEGTREGNVRSYTSYNNLPGYTREGMPLLDTSLRNGLIYCKFEREAVTTVHDVEFDLTNGNYHFLLAVGSSLTDAPLLTDDLRVASTEPLEIIERPADNSIYSGCGTKKTCFGMPENCVNQQTCVTIVTATVDFNNRYIFEMQSTADGLGYVSLGLSRDTLMGDDSVMECIRDSGTVRLYSSWNLRRSNNRLDVPQNILTLINSSFVDGTIYCKFEREPSTIVRGLHFDLPIEDFYFMIALGTAVTETDALITMHNLRRLSSSQPLEIIRQTNIYDGCGTKKTCFGMPADCVNQQTCVTIVTATVDFNNRYIFEMQSTADGLGYVSLGLSRDTLMGDDSVMECIRDNGTVRLYSSWNLRRSNNRLDVPQNILTLITSSFVDGTIYCKFEREPSTIVRGLHFDLPIEDFYFMIALGTAVTETDALITMHNLGRLSSSQPLEIIRQTNIYDGCGTKKTCFGMPADCVNQQTCVTIVTATVDFNNRYIFEMQSTADGLGYVSLGLSRDMLMGDDSVMECIRLYSSWNGRRSNYRYDVPQNILTLINSSFVDGTIYCKFEREPSTIVRGLHFDLPIEDFYFMIALGTAVTETDAMITMHNLGRLSSSQPLEIIRQNYSIYDGCGTRKTCFGTPVGCIATETCRAIVTAVVENEERYEFEMQSGVAGVRYVSFALSEDEKMGDDSVIECVVNEGNVSSYHSWNTERPSFGNTRADLSQDIFTELSSSYTDGTIYCKFEREPSTVVRGHEFDLANREYHFLLAIGSSVEANTIGLHDLGRDGSEERIDLPGRPPVTDAADVLRISTITIGIWLLVTSSMHFLHRL